MHELRAPPRELLQVEALRDRELLKQHVTQRDRRLAEDAVASIGDRDRLGPIGAMRGEILEGDVPAHRREPLGETRAEIATVQGRGAIRDDLAERLREVGLLQDLAGTWEAA